MTIVGVPREVKLDEYRVAMLPVGVEELTRRGHRVVVQTGAGAGSGIPDDAYAEQGAEIVPDAAAVFGQADVIVKVKEPQPAEWPLLQPGQVVFTYFHFAASEELTRGVLETGATAVAYETLRGRKGDLPLLTPMSEVAGRMSVQEGAKYLERPQEGPGSSAGSHRRPWRRSRRQECGSDRGRFSGGRGDPRYQRRSVAVPRRHHAGERQHAVQRSPHDPRAAADGGSGHRSGSD